MSKKLLSGPALIRRVADFIEKEPDRYDQCSVIELKPKGPENICNTVCCIGGAACVLSGTKMKFDGYYYQPKNEYWGDFAERQMGLPRWLTNVLFDADFRIRESKRRNIKEVTGFLRFLATKPSDEAILVRLYDDRYVPEDIKGKAKQNYKEHS